MFSEKELKPEQRNYISLDLILCNSCFHSLQTFLWGKNINCWKHPIVLSFLRSTRLMVPRISCQAVWPTLKSCTEIEELALRFLFRRQGGNRSVWLEISTNRPWDLFIHVFFPWYWYFGNMCALFIVKAPCFETQSLPWLQGDAWCGVTSWSLAMDATCHRLWWRLCCWKLWWMTGTPMAQI